MTLGNMKGTASAVDESGAAAPHVRPRTGETVV